jgi:hypothetical protein
MTSKKGERSGGDSSPSRAARPVLGGGRDEALRRNEQEIERLLGFVVTVKRWAEEAGEGGRISAEDLLFALDEHGIHVPAALAIRSGGE